MGEPGHIRPGRLELGAGFLLSALGLLLDPRLVRLVTGLRLTSTTLLEELAHARILLVLAGLLLVFRRRLLVKSDWRPVPRLAPLLVAAGIFAVLAQRLEEIPWYQPAALACLVQGLAVTGLLAMLACGLAVRLARTRWAAVGAVLPWAVLVPVETVIYVLSTTRLEAQYLRQIAVCSISGYFTPGWIAAGLGLAGLCLAGGVALGRAAMSWAACARVAVILAAVVAADLPFVVHRVSQHAQGVMMDWHKARARYRRLRYIHQDAVVNLAGQLVRLIQTSHIQPIDDLTAWADVVTRHNLPLGDHAYRPLPSPRPRRVVVIFVESLSAFFLSHRNSHLPGPLTPFLDSDRLAPRRHGRYRTAAQPTMPGLACSLTSHPNSELMLELDFPQSVVRVMRDSGWQTAFLMGATRYYDRANRRLADAGFVEVLGAEDLATSADDKAHVRGWGLCDRIVLEKAAKYLGAHRDRDVFLCVLTCDTHLPDGRVDYGGLAYPAPPDWVRKLPSLRGYLGAVRRMDHDLELFFARLQRDGLYDQDTLVVVTADHGCPPTLALSDLPGGSRKPLEEIPLLLYSPRTLPAWAGDRAASQLDLGPTLLHLMGLQTPGGCWGRSLFDTERAGPPLIAVFGDQVTLESAGRNLSFPLAKPETPLEAGLDRLLRTYCTSAPNRPRR